MDGRSPPRVKISRRDLFGLGACGACGLLLADTPGLARPASAQTARKGFTRPRPSPFFTAVEGGHVRCDLCPHACRIAPGKRGLCRVRENHGGVGRTLSYGNPCVVQVAPIERTSFFHVLPGSRSFSVATTGCNLECKFCEVWDTALVSPEEVHAYDLPPEAIVKKAQESETRSVAYTFGEPVVFYEYIADTADPARKARLKNLFHSAGFINPGPLGKLCNLLDAANIDLKGFDEKFYRDLCGAKLAPVLETLKAIRKAGVHLEITNLVIPSINDDRKQIREMCAWIQRELGPDTPLHFSRFYPLYKLANLPPTPVSTLTAARATALEAGLRYVYVANVPGHEAANTFCAHCKKMIIRRIGFMVARIDLKDGKCGHCGGPIHGIWS